jgi:histidine ammonia-lyase
MIRGKEYIKMGKSELIVVGERLVSLNQIVAVAKGNAIVRISEDERFIKLMRQTQAMLIGAIRNGVAVYGVNTGFGKSCGKQISLKDSLKRTERPLDFHGCGTGDPIDVEETRAAMFCRMLCLAKGYSGVSIKLLEQLAAFLNFGITPVVPSEGSVGASGDLTPMSYVAACLEGDREVFYKGRRLSTRKALESANIPPYQLGPKESLSMINGTSTMTGIAALALYRARKILYAAICATALSVHALKGKVHHFQPFIGNVKPFAGQIFVAQHLTRLLHAQGRIMDLEEYGPDTLQDPYSIRCTPQIAGVLFDALTWIEKWVEIEANSSNDNPIFNPDTGHPVMSGNFYGGHIAFAMDSLKSALAAIADMSDRQIILMVNPQTNRGLPADLVGATGKEFLMNHGFKAMSITASALCAETLKATMPAASFSRSCESHNQDKVSLGTIAARDSQRIVTLVKKIVAIHLLAAAQACELRKTSKARPHLQTLIKNIRTLAKGVIMDRPMDKDIENVARAISETDMFDLPDLSQ